MIIVGRICMVRTYSAGVFFGEVVSHDGKQVAMKDARHTNTICGAASLSQLATEGTKAPEKCKFPAPVAEVLLTEAIASIAAVPAWKV